MEEFTDTTIICCDCRKEFVFTAAEQNFYAEKGFDTQPRRCPACRRARKAEYARRHPRYEVICAGCSSLTTIPFEPHHSSKIYCRSCRAKRRKY